MSNAQEATAKHFPEHGPIDPRTGKEVLVSLRNVDITFGKGDKAFKAVKNASFDIYKGETFSLIGESGSGKTTIGRAVIRVNPCSAGEILYKETFTPEQSADLCTLYEGMHIYSEVAAEGRLFFEQDVLDELWKYPVPPHHVWYLESGKQVGVYGKLSDFFRTQNIGVEKFNLYGVPEELQQPIIDGLRVRPYVEFLDGTSENIQFYSTNTDRVKAMETLLDHLGLTFDNVMSIGDSMGMDASMISRAALGVAMENGDERLKKIADAVTDRFDRDGFAKAIEKFILCED